MNFTDKSFIKELKQTILASRYKAAKLANRELLLLYMKVGSLLSHQAATQAWGSKVLEHLSKQLQAELPGLRGFSSTNLKRMRILFENWSSILPPIEVLSEIGPSVTDQFHRAFFSMSFTYHYEAISKTEGLKERLFYINKTAQKFWSVRTLRHHT